MKTVPTNKPRPSTDILDLVVADLDDKRLAMVVAVFGGPGVGKSRMLSSAPGAIGLIATESKSRATVLRDAKKFKKQVILPSMNGEEISLIRTANPLMLASIPQSCIVIGDALHKNMKPGEIQDEMQEISAKITITSEHPTCCQRHYYRWHVNRVKHFSYLMLEDPRVRTIGVDTFGTFVDDVSMANYGVTGVIDPSEYGFAPREDMNKEIREWLNNMSQKNLVLTHHSKGVWKDGKPVVGKTQQDGKFSKLGHFSTVLIEMVRDDRADVEADDYTGKYVVKVRDCQESPELIGEDLLADGAITFSNLALQVFPDSEPEDWR